MTLYFMSDRELTRLEVLRDLGCGRLTVAAATDLLGLERRQVQRLSKAYQEQGATALISKKRGQPGNRRTPSDVKAQALELIRERYTGFGLTLASEKLRELHGVFIGRETLRIWMLEAGLWADWPGPSRSASGAVDRAAHPRTSARRGSCRISGSRREPSGCRSAGSGDRSRGWSCLRPSCDAAGGSRLRASLVSCLEEDVADPRSSSNRRTPPLIFAEQTPIPR